MRLQQLVDASTSVGSTRSRLQKTATLAELLTQMHGEEIAIGVAYLSGSLLQGRIGLGWTAVTAARSSAVAEHASLTLTEVNAAFAKIAHASGAGAGRARIQGLTGLLARATQHEQDFLIRLISG